MLLTLGIAVILLLFPETMEGDPEDTECSYCGVSSDNKYERAYMAKIVANKYPWLVALKIKNSEGKTNYCSASFISQKFILTAASCVVSKQDECFGPTRNLKNCTIAADKVSVYPFLENLNSTSNDSKIKVKRVLPYPKFEQFQTLMPPRHDIALLQLSEKIQCGSNVTTVCLPGERQAVHDRRIKVAGLSSQMNGTENNGFTWVESVVYEIPPQECIAFENDTRKHEEIFCNEGNPRNSTCAGVPGASVVVRVNGVYYALAVVSAGQKDFNCTEAEMNSDVNVPHYLGWIHRHAKQLPASPSGKPRIDVPEDNTDWGSWMKNLFGLQGNKITGE